MRINTWRHACWQMFDRQEDFRLADEDREAMVKACTDRVRMAASEEELDASFARVTSLLDEVSPLEVSPESWVFSTRRVSSWFSHQSF